MKKILFATTNENKIKEAKEILGVEIEPVSLEIDEIQTLNPIKCVETKARFAYAIIHQPILVEDTSLFFNLWNGLPGVFIDYFMKSIGNEGLLRLLENAKDRNAYAQTSLCYIDQEYELTTTGIVKGTISKKIIGTNGFGWDPIFIPQSYKITFAQMSNKEKNKISMRKIALEKLRKGLQI